MRQFARMQPRPWPIRAAVITLCGVAVFAGGCASGAAKRPATPPGPVIKPPGQLLLKTKLLRSSATFAPRRFTRSFEQRAKVAMAREARRQSLGGVGSVRCSWIVRLTIQSARTFQGALCGALMQGDCFQWIVGRTGQSLWALPWRFSSMTFCRKT